MLFSAFLALFLLFGFSGVSAQTLQPMVLESQYVAASGVSEISNKRITVAAGLSADPVILVRSGAELKITGSLFDLSAASAETVILIEEGGTLTIDGTEFSGWEGQRDAAVIRSSGGNVQVQNHSQFSNNTRGGNIISCQGGGKLNIRESEFKDNPDIWGNVIKAENTDVQIRVSNFENNGFGLEFRECQIDIRENTSFSKNYAALRLRQCNTTIDSSVFSENTSYEGSGIADYEGTLWLTNTRFENNISYGSGENSGGAIDTSGTYLTIDHCEFRGNRADYGGGGACTFNSLTWERINSQIQIKNSYFIDNSANYGGALVLGNRSVKVDPEIMVYIESTVFQGNKETERRWGGSSAIWNGGNVHTRINNLAVYDNLGGGITTSSKAETIIHGRNGAVIFGNHSGSTPDYLNDITAIYDDSVIQLSKNMFNGGLHHWQRDDAHHCQYSQPVFKDVSLADVIVTENFSPYDPEAPEWGHAILNYGILEIGEAETSLEVQKVWEDDENTAGKRPSPETFLSSLEIGLNGAEYDAGDLSPVETYERADGKEVQRYHYSADSSLTAEFTAEGAQTWSVRLDGLPLEIDGEKAVYDIKEQPISPYAAEIRETGEGVFSIRNSLIPEPTPTPVPEDELTVFYLLMQGGSLPQTGFSSEHEGGKTQEP